MLIILGFNPKTNTNLQNTYKHNYKTGNIYAKDLNSM